jgi:IS30 family transposase
MSRLGPLRKRVRGFWLYYLAGATKEEAAVAAGANERSGRQWFEQAGGVVPHYVTAPPPGTRYLSVSEREEVLTGIERGESIRSISLRLRRAPSTVQRELRRNMKQQYRTRSRLRGGPGRPRTEAWEYRPSIAQRRADNQARRPQLAKLRTNPLLRAEVQAKLEENLSPEQIAAELRQEYPNNPEMWVSHETIYQSIYVQGRGALRRELAKHLRTGRALRKPRRKTDERRGRIPNMLNISQRPPEVADRSVPGHWEGDLLVGKEGRSAIATLVERATRFVLLVQLRDGFGPSALEAAMLAATRRIPEVLWKSLTWDQGWEMRYHTNITLATGLKIYFCDPSSPWQRGSNENTNGLLRQYFPKGTDLRVHSQDDLDIVAAQLNRRPRKTLGWKRPAVALQELISNDPSYRGVASTA